MPAILTAPVRPKVDVAAARLEADRAAATIRTINAGQNAKAAAVKLDRLARRDPAIRAVIEERNGCLVTVDKLRERLAAVDAKHAALATEASRLAENNASLAEGLRARDERITELEQQLAAALKPKNRANG